MNLIKDSYLLNSKVSFLKRWPKCGRNLSFFQRCFRNLQYLPSKRLIEFQTCLIVLRISQFKETNTNSQLQNNFGIIQSEKCQTCIACAIDNVVHFFPHTIHCQQCACNFRKIPFIMHTLKHELKIPIFEENCIFFLRKTKSDAYFWKVSNPRISANLS